MWLVASFQMWQSVFEHRLGHMGFVMNKVAGAEVFNDYFGFS
jgi:hypothetical protein